MTLKVAVIGIGAMGRQHARVYADLPNVELVGIADIDAVAASAVARRYGGRPYTNYCQMLDETEPDAISLAVPTAQHLEVSLEVVRRGIHLLVEKPIAPSVAKGEEVIASAR